MVQKSVEILTKGDSGVYTSTQANEFPVATSNAVGAIFNGLPHICVGYSAQGSNQCFAFVDGDWNNVFDLQTSLSRGEGSSIVFNSWGNITNPWWILGGDPFGRSTQLLGGNPPMNIVNHQIELPEVLNQACIVTISSTQVFVIARPKLVPSPTNKAWIYNFVSNTWTQVPDTIEAHTGPSCSFITNLSGDFVVLAGGKTSTTEIFDLSAQQWSLGPSLPEGVIEKGRMVSDSRNQEVLLIGGFIEPTLTVSSSIWRMDSCLQSWVNIGTLSSPRADHVLLSFCPNTTSTSTTTSTFTTSSTRPSTITTNTL